MADFDVSINFETASEKTIEQETLRVEITDAKGNPHTVHGSVKVNFIKKKRAPFIAPGSLGGFGLPRLCKGG